LLQIVDIGLGSVDENAANVFSLLENVTKNSTTINTFADISASVQVLYKLSQKISSINTDSSADVSITHIFLSYYWVSDVEAKRAKRVT